jgi:HEAT repeat protein
MTQELPVRIVEAFEAEESGCLDLLIRNRKPEDLAVLRTVARNEEHHFDALEQRKALYALGRWGDRTAIPDILRALPDLDAAARIAAIEALGRIGGDEEVDAIAEYSEDDSAQVRKFAIKALERIGTRDALAQLRRIAAKPGEEDWLRALANQASNSRRPQAK